MSKNVRAQAAKVLLAVLDKGQSLSDVLPKTQQQTDPKDAALLQEMCFGAIRYFPKYDALTNNLLAKKLKGKQRVFHHLIIIGLYQLDKMRIPEHAAVSETVQAAVSLKAHGLKGLVNACLRNYHRNKESLEIKTKNLVTEFNHPSWFIKRIQNAYPETWKQVLQENLQRAPMWLRVHSSNIELDEFVNHLAQETIEFEQPLSDPKSILLAGPKPVQKIPGFATGAFAVQDGAAQHAARLLAPQDGETILDACAAPGGKTCHLLDLADAKVYAADIDETRLARVEENLTRLKLTAELVQGDLASDKTTDGLPQFDRILLDAPCSATGVIRRHPDIKWLRRDEDIEALAKLQRQILDNLWGKLKVGGQLLYATCSILPEENKAQMKSFLAQQKDAKLLPLEQAPEQSADDPGWQILPGDNDMDGFYYCLLTKQ